MPRKRRRPAKRRPSAYQGGAKVIIPPTRKVKLTYNDRINISSTAVSTGVHVFSCNSLHDPDVTGTGHQPMFYDQIAAYYDHYKVVGSKITAKFTSTSDTITGNAVVGIQLADTSSTALSRSELAENPRVSRAFLLPMGSDDSVRHLTRTFSNRKFFGARKETSDVTAQIGLSPAEQAYFICWMHSSDPSSAVTPAVVYLDITIEYLCEFSEPKEVGGS